MLKVIEKNVSDIKEYKNNPRIISKEAVEKVANSIKKFGFKVPIVIDKNGTIVNGHTRLKASKMLGIEKVPCIIADDLTPEQINAFRLADNKVSEFSEWDDAKLDLELMNLDDMDMSIFGFDGMDEGEDPKKKEHKRMLESMELKAFEHYDYLVFVFDNQMDWLNVVNEFKIKKVNAGYGKTKKVGVGLVLRGKELLERIGHESADSEQEQI